MYGNRLNRQSLILITLAVASSAYLFTSSMIIPALGLISRELSLSAGEVSWMITGSLLVSVVVPPIAGKLGDIYGKPRVLVIILAIFAAGGVVAGIGALSKSLMVILAGRALQGFGAATLPLSFGIIRDTFPSERFGPSVSLLSSSFGVGAGLGLVVAGPLVSALSWDWLFWFGSIVVCVALAASLWVLPTSSMRRVGSVDWLGAILLSIGMSLILLTVSALGKRDWTGSLGCGLAGGAALFLFVQYEARIASPLISTAMLRSRAAMATNLEAFAVGVVQFGSTAILPLLLMSPSETGVGLGASASEAGLYILPSTITMVMAAPIAAFVSRRFGAPVQLIAGSLLMTVSFLGFAFFHQSGLQIIAWNAVFGAGAGFATASIATLVMGSVKQSEAGVAAGVNTVFRMTGGAVGTQITVAFVDLFGGDAERPDLGYVIAFFACAGIAVLPSITARYVPRLKPA
ncbi:MFS transporter [Pseudomonas asiatica]|uniref:MFS transporter n=1 Tax=Pseudomonas asiatica TaxID=2219225 RepID=UPI0018ABBB94|nr:MFS transporter [Pseudomonas asiatica]